MRSTRYGAVSFETGGLGVSHAPKPIPENQLDEILEGRQILKQLADSKAPVATFARDHKISRSKIYRLKRKQVLGATALVDARHHNKGRPVKIHEKAVAWVFCCLAEYPRMKLTQVAEKLKEACQRHNIQAPSYDQLRRLIKTTPKDLISFLTKRYEDFYEDDCLKVRRHFGYPLQLVQMDSTMLDIYVMDPISGDVYRPWITVGIDMYSRIIPGFYLHKDAPSARTSTAALKRIILPTGRDDLPFYGKMETITVDQHGSNIAGHLKSQMVNMGIDYVPNHPQCSDENGGIERFFRTLKEGLLATLPGYTEQADALARAKKGCLTEQMLLKRIYRWLLKYHTNEHSALGCAPWDKWHDNLAVAYGQVFDLDLVRSALQVIHESKVLTDGVHLPDGRIFSGAQLVGLVGEQVTVFYDPERPVTEVDCYHGDEHLGKLKDSTYHPELAQQINSGRQARLKEFRKFRKKLQKIAKENPLPEPDEVARVQARANKRKRMKRRRKTTPFDDSGALNLVED